LAWKQSRTKERGEKGQAQTTTDQKGYGRTKQE
jgi:hypothetical protein